MSVLAPFLPLTPFCCYLVRSPPSCLYTCLLSSQTAHSFSALNSFLNLVFIILYIFISMLSLNHFFLLYVVSCIKQVIVTAWGRDGHQVVANIANYTMSKSDLQRTNIILKGQSMYEVANWADDIAEKIPWSYSLHYINVMQEPCDAKDGCQFVYNRDCVDDICVAGAILNYTNLLIDSLPLNDQVSPLIAEQAENSIRFLVHYVGDIHQPLHAARDVDRGGNTIDVVFYVPGQGEEWNLHSVWDFGLIVRSINETYMGSQDQFTLSLIDQLNRNYSPEEVNEWTQCLTNLSAADIRGLKLCVESWGQESLDLALSDSYLNEDGGEIVSGDEISDQYYYERLKSVRERLIMAGVRLAAVLDFSYSL